MHIQDKNKKITSKIHREMKVEWDKRYNAVDLLDAHKDSFNNGGIICKNICLIFFMVNVYYLTPVCT